MVGAYVSYGGKIHSLWVVVVAVGLIHRVAHLIHWEFDIQHQKRGSEQRHTRDHFWKY